MVKVIGRYFIEYNSQFPVDYCVALWLLMCRDRLLYIKLNQYKQLFKSWQNWKPFKGKKEVHVTDQCRWHMLSWWGVPVAEFSTQSPDSLSRRKEEDRAGAWVLRVRVNRLVWWSRLWHAVSVVSAVSEPGGARSQPFSCSLLSQDHITVMYKDVMWCGVKCDHDLLPPVQRAGVRGSAVTCVSQ